MRQIVGKQTSESAYLSSSTLRDAFSLVLPKIAFNGNGIRAKVTTLEQQLAEKDALIKELQQKLGQNDNKLSKMQVDFEERLTWLENKNRKKERIPID